MNDFNAYTTSSGPTLKDMLAAVEMMRAQPKLEPLPRVESNLAVPKHPKKWQFPSDRFVEYEESDERWAKPLGFGHYVEDTDSLVAWKIDFNWDDVSPEPVIYAHPDVVEKMREQMAEQLNDRLAREIFGPQ